MRATGLSVSEGVDVRQLPVDSILPQNYNLRPMDEKVLIDLERSIRSVGVLQPIMVRPRGAGRFEIIFGNHRFRAALRSGLRVIPSVVRETSNQEAFLLQVTENLHRNIKINGIAEARGYKQLIKDGWSIHQIARVLGKSDSYICDRLRLLDKLAPEIQEMLRENHNGPISVSHAEQLSLAESKEKQLKLANLIKTQKLSVRQLERLMGNGASKLCICPICSRVHRPLKMGKKLSTPIRNE